MLDPTRCLRRGSIFTSWKPQINSSFTLKALQYTLAKLKVNGSIMAKTRIVYPPLPRMHEYTASRNTVKSPCVAVIGRFSPEKRFDLAAEAARLTPKIKYYIAGEVGGGALKNYYERLKREAPPNVTVIADIPHILKLKLLSRCTVYMHTMIGEHFGITPLEAMAAGATLVVPTFGGTWTDICLRGEYCYGYTSTDPKNLAEKVLEALERPKIAPLEHVEKFSPEMFMKEIVEEVHRVASNQ